MVNEDVKVPEGLEKLMRDFAVAAITTPTDNLYQFAADYFDKQLKVHEEAEKEKEKKKQPTYIIVSDDEDAFEPDPIEIKKFTSSRSAGRRRKSVWAERYDPEAETEEDVLPTIPKSEEELVKLRQTVAKIWMFQALEKEEVEKVLSAMTERKVEAGVTVIKQGDAGDNFYVIESGSYDVHIKNEEEEEEQEAKFIHTLTEGSFGELALMYNMPRTATVVSSCGGTLWVLDRRSFQKIVTGSAYRNRKLNEELLSKVKMQGVEIMASLNSYMRLNLADALQSRNNFEAGDRIIKEGDVADGMYFVAHGGVKILKSNPKGDDVEVLRLGAGSYFGELGLINNAPRAASIYALSAEDASDGQSLKLAFLERDAFERLLGPCIELMKESAESYVQVDNHDK